MIKRFGVRGTGKMAAATDEERAQPTADVGAASIPAELLLRRDRNVRYERGGTVYATDGRVGVLKQVVVDEAAGAVSDLIVQVDDGARTVLLPPDLVDKTAGSAVFVSVNRVQFAERTAAAPTYDKRGFARVEAKTLLKNGAAERKNNPRRAVIQAGRDFVETPVGNLVERLDRRGILDSVPAAMPTAMAVGGRRSAMAGR